MTSTSVTDGSSVTLYTRTSFSGGSSPYACYWLGEAPGASQYSVLSSFTTGCSTTGTPSFTTSALNTAGTWSFKLFVNDSDTSPSPQGYSNALTVTATTVPLSGVAVSPSPATIDSGQSIGLTASPTGGTGPFSYQWYTGASCTSPISGATSATYNANSAGTYYVEVTDSLSATACSSGDAVTINISPTAGAITAPGSTIDSGQSLLLTSHPSGGTGSFTYQWYSGTSSTCSSDALVSGATSPTYTVPTSTSAGTYYYCYIITDTGVTPGSSPTPTATSSTFAVIVDTTLAAPSISASPSATDTGGSSTLSVVSGFSGGTSAYTCQWRDEAPIASSYSNLGSSFSCAASNTSYTEPTGALATTGAWNFELQVTDSANTPVTVTSSAITVTVNATPSSVSLGSFATNPTSTSTSDSVQVSWTGGTGPFTVTVYQETSSTSCLTTTQVGQNPVVSSSPSTITFTTPNSGGTIYYCAVVTDADSNSANSPAPEPSLTVASGPSSVTLGTFSLSPVDVSTSDSISVTWSGGTGPFIVTLYYSTSSSSCTSANVQAAQATSVASSPKSMTFITPSSANTYYFCATVEDANSVTAASSTSGTSLTVDPALTPGTISPTPTIDDGQHVTLTANPTGGSGSDTYQWYTTPDCSTTQATGTSNAATYSAPPSSTTTYYVKVTDSSGNSVCSSGDTVTVNPVLSAGSIAPSSARIDSGQSIQLSASWTGGTSTYSVTWYSGTSATCSSDTNVVVTHTSVASSPDTESVSPTISTYYCAVITDSAAGTPAQSVTDAAIIITVNSGFSSTTVNIFPSASIDSGQSVTLSASWTGGTSTFIVTWYSGGSATCSADTTLVSTHSGLSGSPDTQSVSPTSNTYYCAVITDSAGGTPAQSATDAAVLVTVDTALSAGAITPASPTIDSGQSVTLTAHPSGGTGSYAYQWYSGASTTCSTDTTALGTSATQVVSPTSNT
ncbi:MAG: hypothetical protein JRM99_03860, partial [Nitrososphaerota archaeon]|nr:hypothetical protein [Nitrososphaerota archaeon]